MDWVAFYFYPLHYDFASSETHLYREKRRGVPGVLTIPGETLNPKDS